MSSSSFDRREFLKQAGGVGAALGATQTAFAARPAAKMSGRVIGANDRIQVATIGVGGRGFYVTREFHKLAQEDNKSVIVGVCDTYQKRVTRPRKPTSARGRWTTARSLRGRMWTR